MGPSQRSIQTSPGLICIFGISYDVDVQNNTVRANLSIKTPHEAMSGSVLQKRSRSVNRLCFTPHFWECCI